MLMNSPFASNSVLVSKSVTSDEGNLVLSSDGRKVVNAENNVNQKEGHLGHKVLLL